MLRSIRNLVSVLRTTVQRGVAISATLIFRTHRRRWRKVAVAGVPPWDMRNRIIAGYIPAGSSLIDIGSGAQTLRTHLDATVEYQPCDCVATTPDVILCDFNAGQPLPTTYHYDYVVCSGILEYIIEPSVFVDVMARLGGQLLLSYNPIREGDSRFRRMANNWVNHLSREQLEKLFSKLDLKAELLNISDAGELLYRVTRRG